MPGANPEPRIVTAVPPVSDPTGGVRPVIDGTARYAKRAAQPPTHATGSLSPGSSTVTGTCPVLAVGGATAQISLGDTIVNVCAGTPPNRTRSTLPRWRPTSVTVVPPASG